MKTRDLPLVFGTLSSAGASAAAVVFFLVRRTPAFFPEKWLFEYLILLVVFLIFSFSPLILRTPLLRLLVILLKFSVFLLVEFPGGDLVFVRYFLLASLFLDLASVFPPWPGAATLGLLALAFLVVQHWDFDKAVFQGDFLATVLVLVFASLPAVLLLLLQNLLAKAENLERNNETLHSAVLQLTSVNTEFLQHASTAGLESAANERNRITRELHDVIGMTLTNIIMMMDAALHRTKVHTEENVKLFHWVRKQAQSGLEETRAALYELRSIRHDQLRGIKALKKLMDTFSSLSKIKIRVEWGNLPWTYEEEKDFVIYRLVQESLSNSFRHGLATLVEIHFFVQKGVLELMIRDNGKGGADMKKGIGQSGMVERIKNLSGNVTFKSSLTGYTVFASVPFTKEDE